MGKRGHGWTRPRPHWKRPLPGRKSYTFKIDVYREELDFINNLYKHESKWEEIYDVYRFTRDLTAETDRGRNEPQPFVHFERGTRNYSLNQHFEIERHNARLE